LVGSRIIMESFEIMFWHGTVVLVSLEFLGSETTLEIIQNERDPEGNGDNVECPSRFWAAVWVRRVQVNRVYPVPVLPRNFPDTFWRELRVTHLEQSRVLASAEVDWIFVTWKESAVPCRGTWNVQKKIRINGGTLILEFIGERKTVQLYHHCSHRGVTASL